MRRVPEDNPLSPRGCFILPPVGLTEVFWAREAILRALFPGDCLRHQGRNRLERLSLKSLFPPSFRKMIFQSTVASER